VRGVFSLDDRGDISPHMSFFGFSMSGLNSEDEDKVKNNAASGY
jgi:hypothetical protein